VLPLLQHEGAVVEHFIRIGGEGIPRRFHEVLLAGEEAHELEIAQEVVHGSFQDDLQGLVVQGLDPHLGRIGDLALVVLGAIHDAIGREGVFRRHLGVQQSLEGVDEVLGRHRRAIAPLGVPKVEGVHQTVDGDLPFFRHAWQDLPVVDSHEPLPDVDADDHGGYRVRLLGVEPRHLGVYGIDELLGPQGGAPEPPSQSHHSPKHRRRFVPFFPHRPVSFLAPSSPA